MTERQDPGTEPGAGSIASNVENSAQTQLQPPSHAEPGEGPRRRGPPPNPLYHPLFLPVLLIAFSLWFGYDGFLTNDPEMLKHQTFNRIMFAIMLPLCIWMVPRGIKEFRETQAQAQAANTHSDRKPS